jgi:hypothetical protein
VKYNLVIDGRVASGCTIPVMTMSGSKTFSQRRYSGEPVVRKYTRIASPAHPTRHLFRHWTPGFVRVEFFGGFDPHFEGDEPPDL